MMLFNKKTIHTIPRLLGIQTLELENLVVGVPGDAIYQLSGLRQILISVLQCSLLKNKGGSATHPTDL